MLLAATAPIVRRFQSASRPSVASRAATRAACRATTASETLSPAAGVPTYGTSARASRRRRVRATIPDTSWSPCSMSASPAAASAPFSEDRAERAVVPSASTWSASALRSVSAASRRAVTSASLGVLMSVRPEEPGGWSSAVTSPAAPSAMTTTIRK